jgi:ribosomal protein S20
MAKVRVSKETQRLFLKLLNFTPELLAKTQEEAKLQNISFDTLVRTAVEKYLRALTLTREQEEAKEREYTRLVLRAHFAEDRNEFLNEGAIRAIGQKRSRYCFKLSI